MFYSFYMLINVLMHFQDYKSIIDRAGPHVLLDVRPLVEVEICSLPFSLSILLFFEKKKKMQKLSHFVGKWNEINKNVCTCSYSWVISLLMLLPDIPLSSLEEKKSKDIQLLQEKISQVKQQMAGDQQAPGNLVLQLRIHVYTLSYTDL